MIKYILISKQAKTLQKRLISIVSHYNYIKFILLQYFGLLPVKACDGQETDV